MVKCIYRGTSSMTYKGQTVRSGGTIEVPFEFYKKHISRLMKIEEDVIEAEFEEVVEKPKAKRKPKASK